MNTQQNPTTPQGQEPEPSQRSDAPAAADAAHPAGESGTTQVAADAAAPRAAQDAHTEQLPAAHPPQPPATASAPTPPPAPPSSSAQPPAAPASATPAATAQPPATAENPQAMHQPGHGAPSAAGGGSFGNPYAVPGAAQKPRKERRWAPVVAAAAIAAVLASAGTAGAISLLDDGARSASLADVGQGQQQNAVPVSSDGEAPDWQAVAAAVQESVVAIQVATQSGEGEGSGVIIDAEGHILTNNHVVAGAEQVQVTLADGRLVEAEVVGTDPTTDLAVVKLSDVPDDISPATIGDSDAVTTGDPVMAVGNPLGLAGTATTGIVSALDRPVTASAEDGSAVSTTNAVQTDAAVNPGNSGGPLFNANGEVIGINSSILSLSGGMGGQAGSIGLGFAIPSNLASTIGQQMIDDGTVEHAFLGVSMTNGTATADGVTRRGAEVREVVPGSPADEAGLRIGDVVVAIGEDPVDGSESLTAFVREHDAGDDVTLTVVGDDGATRQVDVKLAVLDEDELTQMEEEQLPGQDGMPGQEGSDGSGGEGSGQSDPGNVPDWLEDLFGN